MKVAVVGAGIGGIATAIRMAAKGYKVNVFEANTYPGGKLSEFRIGDYRFDAGPSLFTMPQYVEELFELAGKNAADYFEYERLPTICNYFWEDGSRLEAAADKQAFAATVEEVLDTPRTQVLDYFEKSALKYEATGRIFLEKSLHKADTWLNVSVLKALLKMPQYDIFTSMHHVNKKTFENPKLVQLFDRYATYNGSNPYIAPGLLNIIPHFEFAIGAYFPRGGMYSITKSLVRLAEDIGVQFHFGQLVDKILVEQKTAKGLQVAGDQQAYDLVVSNMDVFHAYRKLLPDQKPPKRILRQAKSTSALIFYWGIKQSFPELDLHNILFSDRYKEEFDHLEAGAIIEDPTVYINISSKYHSADAPEGCENWFTMINVPCNSGQDWDTLIEQARANIIRKVSRMLETDIAPLIVCEQILEPRTIESKTQSHLGALYGTSSNNRMAAFLRHPNFSRRIKNLYFCGGSVHPGGGIPLSLLSAKIIDELIGN